LQANGRHGLGNAGFKFEHGVFGLQTRDKTLRSRHALARWNRSFDQVRNFAALRIEQAEILQPRPGAGEAIQWNTRLDEPGPIDPQRLDMLPTGWDLRRRAKVQGAKRPYENQRTDLIRQVRDRWPAASHEYHVDAEFRRTASAERNR
jgi:hypothetical protein